MRKGWRVADLGACVAEIRSGKSVNSLAEPAGDGEPGVLKTSCVYRGRFEPGENKRIVPSEQDAAKCPAMAGTIIVSRMNTYDLVGSSGYVDRDYPNIFLPDRLWAVIPRDHIDPRWLYYVVSSQEFRARLSENASGTSASMKNISQDVFLSMPVRIPPFLEQERISESLQTWDEAILKQDRLTELFERQYIGLRNQLIDWSDPHTSTLTDIVDPILRPVSRPIRPYYAVSIRSHGKGTFARRVDNPELVEMETLFEVKAGDIVVNITFAWEGAIALVPSEHDGHLVSHRFPTFVPKPEKVSARFLRHALRTARFTHLLGLVSPGGAGRNRVLNKRDFLSLEVPTPSLERQVKVAAALDSAELQIQRSLELQASLLRQKRGLMQKLLTGEWRVAV